VWSSVLNTPFDPPKVDFVVRSWIRCSRYLLALEATLICKRTFATKTLHGLRAYIYSILVSNNSSHLQKTHTPLLSRHFSPPPIEVEVKSISFLYFLNYELDASLFCMVPFIRIDFRFSTKSLSLSPIRKSEEKQHKYEVYVCTHNIIAKCRPTPSALYYHFVSFLHPAKNYSLIEY
jgi:hypothetical protein